MVLAFVLLQTIPFSTLKEDDRLLVLRPPLFKTAALTSWILTTASRSLGRSTIRCIRDRTCFDNPSLSSSSA